MRPRLGPMLRERFDAPPWNADDDPGEDDASRDRDFWKGRDPDLTTPQNEALLDYRHRLALALLLFGEGDRLRRDMRAELFARYGAPAQIDYNPSSDPLQFSYNRYVYNPYSTW